jgi:IclR family KDG regulon transcriptional repressor
MPNISKSDVKKSAKKKAPVLKSVDKAFCILSYLAQEQGCTLNELAKKSGLSKGTVHRILLTGNKRGFIEQNPESGHYQLGMKVFEMGNVVAKRMVLINESLPILKKASEQTGETAHVIIRHFYEAVCIQRVEGNSALKILFMDVGKRMPLHIGAGPNVLLAHLSDEEIQYYISNHKIEAWTEHTVTDAKKIWENVLKIRKQEYALSVQDATIGVAAVGAPIRNHNGDVIGVVSIAGLATNFQGENLEYIIDAVKSAGNQISYRMG